jgi:hypothetical protein
VENGRETPWDDPLRWGIDLGLTFQSVPGPQITASYTVTSAAAVGLARPLSGGSATVPLIAPGTMFGARMQQTDLRLAPTYVLPGVSSSRT